MISNFKSQILLLLLCACVSLWCFADSPQTGTPRRLLAADYQKKVIAIVNEKNDVEWQERIKDIHDVAVLPGGNILFQTDWTTLVEMTPDKKIVWKYDAAKTNGNAGKKVEVHAFQRLADGVTMIAESGPGRIIEVDRDGKLLKEVKLKVAKPDPHRDTRLVRKLQSGNYLVCHEADAKVREYDRDGKVVWSYTLDLAGRKRSPGHGPEGHGTEVFGAIRLPSGNTLIGGGNNNRVIEVDKDGKVVWSIGHDELPGIRLAWVTTVAALPGGNVLVGNCHAGPDSPQLFEVTRDKKVVWSFKDFKAFGNSLAVTHVIGPKGKVVR